MSARLGGRYQIVAEIGAGGMGRVYQAIDTESGRAVAAKVMAAAEENLDALLRFQQEGAVLATLRHPNIVEVYGAFLEVEQQTSCIIMELLEGRSLGQILRTERLGLARARHLISQVASALTYAHGRGIVHRDIKPDNIMVVGNDHVKVTDFGIARILRTGSTLNTAAGMSVGTPLYMSPEQIEGQKVDGRSDIYSLGAVMYQIVTGRPPFEGDDPLTIAFKHVHKAPDAPSDVAADIPPAWEEVILKALAKDPGDRYQTAAALEDAVRSLPLERGQPVQERPPAATSTQLLETPQAGSTAVNAYPDRPASLHDARPTAGGTARGIGGTPPVRPEPGAGQSPAAGGAARDESARTGVSEGSTLVSASNAPRARRATLLWVGGGVLVLLAVVVAALALTTRGTSHPAAPTIGPGNASPVTQVSQFGSSGSGNGELRSPAGVAVDHSGNVFVADAGNNRIQEFASSTDFVGTWGGVGAEVGQYSGPSSVALDSHANIYIADTGNSRIQELSSTGRLLTQPWGGEGTAQGEFDHPSGIAVDSQGNIYVADTGNDRIQKLSPTGQPIASWGSKGTGASQFNRPTGVALDSQGDIYVADTGNNRIVELAPTSDPIGQWGRKGSGKGEFNQPQGVAVDGSGNIFIADTGNDRIQELDASGHVVLVAGSSGTGAGQFQRPIGIAIDARGRIFVADSGNDRVQELSVPRGGRR